MNGNFLIIDKSKVSGFKLLSTLFKIYAFEFALLKGLVYILFRAVFNLAEKTRTSVSYSLTVF